MADTRPKDSPDQGSGTSSRRIAEISKDFPVIFPVAMLLFGTLVISIIFAILVYMLKSFPVVTSLPIIAVLGIVTLLFALSGIAYVFAGISLGDKSQAMALPPGTIQAVIALSLVVMFSILSVFVFQNSSEGGILRLGNLDSVERDEQIKNLGTSVLGWERDANNKFTLFVQS